MNEKLITSRQAFEAMQLFLEQYYERIPSDDIAAILSDLEFVNYDTTADPAAILDWNDYVNQVVKFSSNMDEEIDNLKKMISEEPNNSSLLIKMGILYFIYKIPNESINFINKAIEKDKTNADYYFWLAICYLRLLSDFKKAKEVLEYALKIDPENVACLSKLAIIQMYFGNDDVAMKLINKAILNAPDWIIPRKTFITLLLREQKLDVAENEVLSIIKMIKDLPLPDDIIERYFEQNITGRIDPNNQKYFEMLLNNIRSRPHN